MAAGKAWQARKASAGYACITWPAAIGGGGGTPIQSVIFGQEEAKAGVGYGYFTIGLGMCVPTVMAFANDETKQRFVSPAVKGEEIWCQLFSEPAGGSDVAALRTRAVKDGDDWVINGQKVWTTGAHYCDYGILLVRTDPDVPKHKGLTMFWIDMRDAAVECRPIHQMSGGREFNEVYFTDLRVKDSQRLGAVGDGWKVALVTLMNERLAVGGSAGPDYRQVMELARGLSANGPALKDQAFRERLADWYVNSQGLKFTPLPDHDRPVARPDAGAGELDRQDHLGQPAAGPGQHRRRGPGRIRDPDRSGPGPDGGGVPAEPDVGARPADRRRHRRDPQEHHRRTGAGPARRRAGRQGRGVQGHAHRALSRVRRT